MSAGPPPVPGGRSPEEREAARREREARRAAQRGDEPPPPPSPRDVDHDWLADAERLTGRGATATAAASAENGDVAPPREPRRFRPEGDRPRPRVGRLVALGLIVAVVLGVAWFANSLFQPFAGDGEGRVRVVIPQGATLGEIAELLERREVVDSASFFELRARLSGRSDQLKPGPYELQEGMPYMDVLDRLEEGVPPNVILVSIPEGRSRGEVAPLVKRLRGDYRRASRRHAALNPREYKAPRGSTLEGFLFPATYELRKGQAAKRLVKLQLEAFKRNFEEVDLRYARSKNLTPYDVLIIASMVEREAMVDRERPLIASVIYNRLSRQETLGIDATLRYALKQWNAPLKQSELANPTPYNTRIHAGLPPGPIGNPGLASIKAAARPAKTDFLFYVVKPGTCGRHAFSETSAEFEADVARYNAEREKRGGKSPDTC